MFLTVQSGSYPLGLAVLYDAPGLSSSPRSEAATAMRASLVARRLSARGSDHTGLQRASTSAASEGIAPAGVTIVAVLANMAPEGAATADEQGNLPLHHLCRRRNPSRRSLQEVVGAYPEAASQGDWVRLPYSSFFFLCLLRGSLVCVYPSTACFPLLPSCQMLAAWSVLWLLYSRCWLHIEMWCSRRARTAAHYCTVLSRTAHFRVAAFRNGWPRW